jgi:hypothetical protein
MDRVLVLRLRSHGVAAEAWLNGLPLARTPKGGGDCCVPVHEFVIAGSNRLELVVDPPTLAAGAPPPAPVYGDGTAKADASLLLPRVGQLVSEHFARQLGQVAWASEDGEVYRPPVRLAHELDIPVRFPRWRWLDAPPITDVDDLRGPAATFLQDVAIALSRGDPEHLVVAAKLRFEELALAYQRPAADDLARWRARVQLLHAQKALRPELPTPESLTLRPVAGGRLLECLGADGLPVLRCARPDGSRVYWPMRLAAVERRFYPLR